jgi:membrane-bound lytic murein transglycosylase C
VETLDDKDPQGSLRNTIVTTLLTTNDPQAVDLFSDKDVTLATGRQPYLQGLVQDQEGNSVRTREQAERFADYLVQNQSRTRTVQGDEGDKTARSVKVPMIQNFQSKKAEKYSAFVSRFSEQYQVSPSLVYAIIRTESNFNPFAVSSAPAYGLMQLVPTSGGRAAYKRVKGTDETPSSEYLFDPEHNIELGTAYLSVLSHNELEGVSNQQSRDYCVIAAYNTGPGNLLRTFSKKKTAALTEINGLEPVGVYDRLRASLPYEETRQYLGKVVNYRTQFVGPTPPK